MAGQFARAGSETKDDSRLSAIPRELRADGDKISRFWSAVDRQYKTLLASFTAYYKNYLRLFHVLCLSFVHFLSVFVRSRSREFWSMYRRTGVRYRLRTYVHTLGTNYHTSIVKSNQKSQMEDTIFSLTSETEHSAREMVFK